MLEAQCSKAYQGGGRVHKERCEATLSVQVVGLGAAWGSTMLLTTTYLPLQGSHVKELIPKGEEHGNLAQIRARRKLLDLTSGQIDGKEPPR